MENMISSEPPLTQDMTGLTDEEIDELHQEFEADASGNVPGQAYGNTQISYPSDTQMPPVGVPMESQMNVVSAVGGRRRKTNKHKRKKSHAVRSSRRGQRNSRKRTRAKRRSAKKRSSRRQRGGEMAWSKMSSDLFSDHLTPTGIQETGRLQYNVGLPKSLIDNPRVPDSVVQNRALVSIA
jgi:hypothetical protein